ncbi:EAL domain-containing protein [Sulfitobacter sp. LCG007]
MPAIAQIQYHTPAQDVRIAGFALSPRDIDLLDTVREAIASGRVGLDYQPVVMAGKPGRIAFHEALLRIRDVSGRVLPAAEFMPVAERTGLGRTLDVIALDQGLAALHATPDLRLAINISPRTIGNRDWERTLAVWMVRDATVAERLVVEITESSAMEAFEQVRDFMSRQQLNGVSFALDDFGAGHTALRHLRELRFDILKLDGQFARRVANDPDNRAIVEAIVGLARHFEMLTVAEWVESAEDAETLRALGVDCLQGYHFGGPVPRPEWSSRGPSNATF